MIKETSEGYIYFDKNGVQIDLRDTEDIEVVR